MLGSFTDPLHGWIRVSSLKATWLEIFLEVTEFLLNFIASFLSFFDLLFPASEHLFKISFLFKIVQHHLYDLSVMLLNGLEFEILALYFYTLYQLSDCLHYHTRVYDARPEPSNTLHAPGLEEVRVFPVHLVDESGEGVKWFWFAV